MLTLYMITYVAFTAADPLVHCEKNVCLNNGTCLLTSKSAAYHFCHSDESYFDGDCYKVFKQRKTWYEANEICAENRGNLITIENEFQQLFVSNYLLTNLDDISIQNIAIWTAGHVLLNGSQQVYSWPRDTYTREVNLLDDEQQPQIANDNGMCIEIDSQSLYRDSILANCSNNNYFICYHPSNTKSNELENEQCMCHNGFSGRFCERTFDEFGMTSESSYSVACIYNKFEFFCPNGSSIIVDFAAYGNIGQTEQICLTSAPTKVNVTYWEECIHPSSLQTIISICQGLNYCRIDDFRSLFPDNPCLPTTPVTLKYRMRCSFEAMNSCPFGAILQNGLCYIPYVSEMPLSAYNAQMKCRQEGGQLAFLVNERALEEIVVAIQKELYNDKSSCYWMSAFPSFNDNELCQCYYIDSRSTFWSEQNCNSTQQWVCQFAPKIETISMHFTKESSISNKFKSTATSSINDEQSARSKPLFCEEYVWHGITVPRTLACTEIQIPCPDPENSIGVITRKCSCESNEWIDEMDTVNCTHKWIELLNEMIDNDDSAKDITQRWTQFLQNSTKQILFGGDLLGSIEIGENLLSLAQMQYAFLDNRKERNDKFIEFTQAYGEAGDELLSDEAINVWLTLPIDIRLDQISLLISMLERSATLLAEYIIEKKKRIEYINWAFEIQRKESIPLAIERNSLDRNIRFGRVRQRRRRRRQSLNHFTNSSSNFTSFNELNGNVTFNFEMSPIIVMPSLEILQQSVQAGVSSISDSGLLARPRSRPISLTSESLLHLAYCLFKSAGILLNSNKSTITNSLIIGASVNDPTRRISLPQNHPITFKFYHIRREGVSNPRCVFWDTLNRKWSKEGCITLSTINDTTECSCTHLTSFAILMDITGSYDHDKKTLSNKVLNVTTIIGCIFSIICLFLASLIFTCFRSLWNIRHMIHGNLCFCLLFAELIFVIGINRTENKTLCRLIAVALHYFFLAAFSWMFLEGYQLYLMLVQVFESEEGKGVLYCLYAYGFPAIIVAVTVGVAWSNYSTDKYCWLNVETSTIWTFAGPVALVIISNIVFLGVALRVVLSVPSYHRNRAQQTLGWLKGSTTLLCLLGITWIFGYLMIIREAETIFAYIFTILNCFQGVFIFVIHVLLNDKVRLTMKRFIRMNLCCIWDNSTNGTSVISSRQKLIDMMKNSDLSRISSSQQTHGNDDLMTNRKGMFVEKISSRKGKGSPTTLITYLDWKRKISNDDDSGSIPSDECENNESEKKETHPVHANNSFRKNSDDTKFESITVHRNICSSNDGNYSEFKEKRRSSVRSIIIERF